MVTGIGESRVVLRALLVSALVCAFQAVPVARAVTADQADFNGDGKADLTIGAATEAIGSRKAAGAVHVLRGSASGPSAAADQVWEQDFPGIGGSAETGDLFGGALAYGDFNGDGRVDAALGVPGETIGKQEAAGAVAVLYGSAGGLKSSGNKLFYQGAGGLPGRPEDADLFGAALVGGDFNDDGKTDLAVGAPFEGVSSSLNGAVHVLYGSAGGLRASGNQMWTQRSAGVKDNTDPGDGFGAALATGDFNGDGDPDLAIGVPGETPISGDGSTATGAVAILYGSGGGLTAAGNELVAPLDVAAFDDTGFGAAVAAGDLDGDGVTDLAVGAPLFSSTVLAGGAVSTFSGSVDGIDIGSEQLFEQGRDGVSGMAEKADIFGSSLASRDFDADGRDDLAIGAPLEDVGGKANVGAVNVLYGTPNGLSGASGQMFHQDTPGIGGNAEKNDRLGTSIGAADYNGDGADDLSLGAPFEDVNGKSDAGGVNVIFGKASSGLGAAKNQMWTQDSKGVGGTAEKNDRFGFALL